MIVCYVIGALALSGCAAEQMREPPIGHRGPVAVYVPLDKQSDR